ncbi:SIR2 family protein [Paenibacillus sp. J5C_2022]|uniref:SIR2 family protein n=1 Tax=Paenibacillus sp. J5C2022 TaxID=2977129 RepID=UPI0021D1CCE6|nr:SIR2 family protein [Paenibacillus sp. J5C2022]MCU6710553.1 SIR2 family protein [Paenibacillus sp. J5C2022]
MHKDYSEFIEGVVRLNPAFIVGSGLSAGAGISGMGELTSYIIKHIRISKFAQNQLNEWGAIKRRLTEEKQGLEEALQHSGEALNGILLQEIVEQTWRCIAHDEQPLLPAISYRVDPTGFLRYFTQCLTSNIDTIHIITTNYDHLIEWSASSCGWRVWDGFDEGTIGMPLSVDALNEKMRKVTASGRKQVTTRHHHVRVYKPHGSLSWFKLPSGEMRRVQGIGAQLLTGLRKLSITPAIVTPGTGKYLETHQEPYNSVLAEMKQVLDKCRALIFVGFGFNDLHIQGSFAGVMRNGDIPKLILARGLSPNAKQLMRSGKLVNFVAVQRQGSGSEVISDQFNSFVTTEPEHWTLKGMLNQAWGAEGNEGAAKSVSHP